ncbi:hypothetical protein BC833DRAFT_623970 [Globomyces pollinis-pini]|nr:hypothetical protein BC833DRAFT_623970 [Globomyces pollinis-pini]
MIFELLSVVLVAKAGKAPTTTYATPSEAYKDQIPIHTEAYANPIITPAYSKVEEPKYTPTPVYTPPVVTAEYNKPIVTQDYKPIVTPDYKPIVTPDYNKPIVTVDYQKPSYSTAPVYTTELPVYQTSTPSYGAPSYTTTNPGYSNPIITVTTGKPAYQTEKPLYTTPTPAYADKIQDNNAYGVVSGALEGHSLSFITGLSLAIVAVLL